MPQGSRAEHLARAARLRRVVVAALLTAVSVTGAALLFLIDGGTGDEADPDAVIPLPIASTGTGAPEPGATTTPSTRPDVLVDPASFGTPWAHAVEGLLTFRGNPTRSYHGRGPVPRAPEIAWRYPERPMCGPSSEGGQTRTWCGTGWTGQPAVFVRDGRTWLVFGAYDHQVHFLDARSGEPMLPPFRTGDIVKGSVTVDPDGYPLVYTGSRDNSLRVLAIDGAEPVELWALHAKDVGPTMWNDDWDGSPLVLADHLVAGGENSRFHVVALHRGYDASGRVTVAPELRFDAAGWDDELLRDIGDRQVSIEQSVTVSGDTAWFANSGGLLQGWDLSSLRTGSGTPARTFRYWLGDDADASIVADADGYLYVGVEHERATARAREVGQLLKIDPRRADSPVVWAVHDTATRQSGTWSTPAVVGDLVIWPTRPGTVYGIDRSTGAVRWTRRLPAPLMGSPVVVDGVWLQGDCAGVLHAFDVRDTAVEPPELWAVPLGGCIESTPAVWDGRIFVGTRTGYVYALADPG